MSIPPTERRPAGALLTQAARVLAVAVLLLPLGACSLWHKMMAPSPSAAPVAASAPAVPNPPVLLLGEVHDNPQGHRERFEDLKRRVVAGWRPSIALEQFDHENQALLGKAQRDCPDADCLIKVMKGPRWDWPLYRPVLELAMEYNLPLLAANLSRADASRVVRDGLKTTFDAATLAAYQVDSPAAAEIRRGQRKEIIEGHCNMLPDMMIGGMVEAQVARDIMMAKILREELPRDVVLLAGNGHVRNDIGVGRWMKMVSPELNVRSEAYLEQGGAAQGVGLYDFTHLVKAHPRDDPCAKFKKK